MTNRNTSGLQLTRAFALALAAVLAAIGWRVIASSDAGWIKHAITKSVRNVSLPEEQSKVVYLATDVLNYTNAGVFVSTDSGVTFKNVTGALPERVVKDIAVHPSNVKMAYVALLNSGVYQTKNQGTSWTAKNLGLTVQQATALFLNPIAPSTLLLGIKGGSVFRSTNGGGLWTQVGTVTGDVTAFAADPKDKKVYYLGTNKRAVYKSIDSGVTWVQKTVGLAGATANSITSIIVDPLNAANIYLAMSKNGVFKSTDGGESWAQKKTGLKNIKVNDLVLYKKTPSILYAATDGTGIFKSTDSAETWTQFDKLNLTELKILGVGLDQVTGKHLFAGTASAVFDYTLTAP